MSLPPKTIRLARPEDARDISTLYAEAYRPADGGDPSDHYPFPQFLDPDWVAEAVVQDPICWVVAEAAGKIGASAGASRNIGGHQDRVAEIFGIVVDENLRGGGLGTAILSFLCNQIGTDAEFVLCESRTALAAGWRISRACGFMPMGFEPFAHSTPAGSESMLMTGRVSEAAIANRNIEGGTSPRAFDLAHAVLSNKKLPPPPDATNEPLTVNDFRWGQLLHELDPQRHAPVLERLASVSRNAFLCLELDRSRELPAFEWPVETLHDSGVVGLKRLEGDDRGGKRYDQHIYVGRVGGYDLAFARVVWDRVDLRARVLELHTLIHGLQGLLLSLIVYELKQQAAGNQLTLVVDVLAEATDLHATLEQLGFWPTGYFPALVGTVRGRIDAVQYTKLFNCAFEDSLSCLEDLQWEQAEQVVTAVKHLHSRM